MGGMKVRDAIAFVRSLWMLCLQGRGDYDLGREVDGDLRRAQSFIESQLEKSILDYEIYMAASILSWSIFQSVENITSSAECTGWRRVDVSSSDVLDRVKSHMSVIESRSFAALLIKNWDSFDDISGFVNMG